MSDGRRITAGLVSPPLSESSGTSQIEKYPGTLPVFPAAARDNSRIVSQ